jgi:hypothetical protein
MKLVHVRDHVLTILSEFQLVVPGERR